MIEKIEKIIESDNSPEDKSLMIAMFLEYDACLSLSGNGFFDDSEIYDKFQEDVERRSKLINEMNRIVNS